MSAQAKLAGLFAGLYLVGATIYGIIVPVFEGPDEREHIAFVIFIAENWRIPNVVEEYGVYSSQATHAPLYYLVAASFVQSLDLSDTSALPLNNPQAAALDLDGLGNRNGYVHTPLEAWPYQNSIVRAIHIARFISAIFGAVAVAATVLLAARYSLRVALFAGLFVAALPQFLFLGGLVNNEVPIATMSGVGLLMLMRYWERPGWRVALLVGLFIGLALLTKIGGAGLLLLGAIVVLLRRRGEWRLMFTEGSLILIMALLVSGWWLALNISYYGEPTGIAGNLALLPGGNVDYSEPSNVYAMLRFTVFSFWAVFGPTNIAAAGWVYVVLTALTVIALGGLVLKETQAEKRPLLLLCTGWVITLGISASGFVTRAPSWHGRHYFPALGAFAILVAVGSDNLRIRWRAGYALYSLPVGLLIFALLAPPLLIRPAYATPQTLTALPTHVEPLCVEFEHLELLGVEASDEVRPGDVLDVTFYWRMRQAITYDFLLFIRVLDGELTTIADNNTYHGQGNWPTKLWQQNVIYADRVRMRVNEDVKTPMLARVAVLVDRYGEDVPATCDVVTRDPLASLTTVRVVEPQPQPAESLLVLGETVALTAADWPETVRAGGLIPVNLQWYVRVAPEANLTRFIHLEREGVLLAQADGIPAGFPASVWQVGDVLPDTAQLQLPSDIPSGVYILLVGMYDTQGVRLPNDAPDDRAVLGTVEITP